MKFIIHFESSFLTVSSHINHPIKSYAHKTQPDLEHILTIYESQRPRISLCLNPGHQRNWRLDVRCMWIEMGWANMNYLARC